MTVYGYARVSTRGQNLNDQIERLKQAGVKDSNIYSEKFTGTKLNRPELDKLLNKVQPGDTITVTKLDRLARNTKQALDVMEPLMNSGVTFNILNLGRLDNNPMGKMFLTIMLAVATMERDMIVERTQEGKVYAKEHNPRYREGRPHRRITPRYRAIYEYKKTHTYPQTEQAFNVSKATIYRIKKQIESAEAVETGSAEG